MCENCQQLKAELSELLPRLEKIEQTNRDLVELQSVAEKLHANEVQKLQARIAQLEKALKRVHHLASSEGPKPVAWALEESYNVADAAISADPSLVLEVVRAAVEWSEYSDYKYDENGDLEQVATPWPQTARLNRAVEKLGPEWRQ